MIPPRRVAGRLVHPVAFGAMNLSLGPAEADAIATVHAAIDAGAQLVDTADVYGPEIYAPHHNERLIGPALRAHPEVLLSTKVGVVRQGAAWLHCGRPDHLRGACEGSLAALGVETIDLLQLHAVDAEVAIEESVGALARLQEEGKARLLGLSNVTLAEVERARAVAAIASVQNEASVFVAPDPDLVGEAVGRRPRRIPVPRLMLRMIAEAGELQALLSGRPALVNRSRYRELVAPGFVCDVSRIAERPGVRAAVWHAEGLAGPAEWYRRHVQL